MTRDTKEQVGKPSSKQQKDAPMLKIVIRCLPPTLTEEEFLKHVEPLSDHDFFCFVRAESSLEQYACSRAYLNFTNQNDVVAFRDKWDGFPFNDTNGREYPAVVELAPYQKIPKKSLRKPDPRCGTIEEDEDYQDFLEVLNAEIEPLPSAETYLEELEAKQRAAATAKVTTPLIDYLKRKRIERIKAREKAREERRLKEKERKRQREEEKRKLEKERRRKREERERREKEARLKKDEKSSDGEKKADAKKKETEKKDAQIKLLKKTDSKTEQETKSKEDKGSKDDSEQPTRGKPDPDRTRRESEPSQSTPSRDRERPPTSARDRNVDPKITTGGRRPPARDGREGREGRDLKDVREGREGREARDLKDRRDRRDGRDLKDKRDGREGREADRIRGERGTGRDRYSDRRPPSRISSQESLSKTAKTLSRDKVDIREGQRESRESREIRKEGQRDDRRPAGGGREERLVGKGDVRGDKKEASPKKPTSGEQSKETEKEVEAKREERKMRNKDRRPDMVRYQPGQRSWRTAKKEEGSDSAQTSPTSSEGDKPKPEEKKPISSTTTAQPATAPSIRKVEEKRPTAAKKFDSQVRSGIGRSSGGREDSRGKAEPRMGDRNRSVGRGYREERSNRNRQRQGDARKKVEGANGNSRAPQNENDKKT